ncbi:MAG: hypothetical protein AAFU67_12040, partial [Bacteroidota bacterium]
MTITRVAAWLVTIALILTLVVVGKSYLIPVFLALFIWYLVNAINNLIRQIPFIGKSPKGVTLALSFVFIGLCLYFVGGMITNTVNEFVSTAGNYSQRLDDQIARFYQLLGIERTPPTLKDLDLPAQLGNNFMVLLNGATAAAKNFFLVLIYVIFLLLEQGSFPKKLKALGLTGLQADRLETVLNQINTAMRQYLGVKTLMSV